jgi:hypothetical protein
MRAGANRNIVFKATHGCQSITSRSFPLTVIVYVRRRGIVSMHMSSAS